MDDRGKVNHVTMPLQQLSSTRFSEGPRNVFMWPLDLVRDLPKRTGRIMASVGAISEIRDLNSLFYWMQAFAWYIFDLISGPELAQIALRLVSETRFLSGEETKMAKAVLGPRAIRFGDVKIATGGLLLLFFQMNKNRAFATWHTINLPASKSENISLLIHELTHVYQYERVGSVYISQGLWAQFRFGRRAYDYGGIDGLREGRAAGKRLSDYNREQQGQIAQDYLAQVLDDSDTEAYEPFIQDLKHGII